MKKKFTCIFENIIPPERRYTRKLGIGIIHLKVLPPICYLRSTLTSDVFIKISLMQAARPFYYLVMEHSRKMISRFSKVKS